MAQDMFLKLDGISGESIDSTHTGEIQVVSWSWGVRQQGSAAFGSGSGAGKVEFQDIIITKPIDLATPTLWLKCCNGAGIATGLLTVRKAGGTPLEYLKIAMGNLIVSHVSTAGSGGDDVQRETVGLHFQNYKMTYTKQNEGGAAAGDLSSGWDISKNAPVS